MTFSNIILLALLYALTPGSFKTEQLKYGRVRVAFKEKGGIVTNRLKDLGIETNDINLFIRAYKKEKMLEAWVSSGKSGFKLYKTFKFCSSSGTLGPKRKQGDFQIPEGLYFIDRFNPHSNFYLSLGINYPNKSDRIRGEKNNLGGDIFIHGNCVTIGCIPITDDKIKELYALTVLAKDGSQSTIPVHIYPFKMNSVHFTIERVNHPNFAKLWNELKLFDEYFNTKKMIPEHSVNSVGEYCLRFN